MHIQSEITLHRRIDKKRVTNFSSDLHHRGEARLPVRGPEMF
ncbi:hypothetical protein AGMMS50256_37510 [Betaproteobacteria bacterium]|nr:hypothetical protein AGMMS50256_37510 [Betaproteobacteria bacterium]